MSDAAQPVFLSYARRVSRPPTKALSERLGAEVAFLDEQDIDLGDTFPAVLRDAVLGARLVVVFATQTYVERPYCWKEWSLALAPWDTLVRRGASTSALEAALGHILVVLPEPGSVPSPSIGSLRPFVVRTCRAPEIWKPWRPSSSNASGRWPAPSASTSTSSASERRSPPAWAAQICCCRHAAPRGGAS